MFRDLLLRFGELCRILVTSISTNAIHERDVLVSGCKITKAPNTRREKQKCHMTENIIFIVSIVKFIFILYFCSNKIKLHENKLLD